MTGCHHGDGRERRTAAESSFPDSHTTPYVSRGSHHRSPRGSSPTATRAVTLWRQRHRRYLWVFLPIPIHEILTRSELNYMGYQTPPGLCSCAYDSSVTKMPSSCSFHGAIKASASRVIAKGRCDG